MHIIKKLFFIPILFIALSSTSLAADFQKAVTAYEQGDYASALKELTPLAEQGDTEAQYNLGVMYYKGEGTPQDYKAALKWYTRAAEQGVAKAQYNLGVMHANGEGTPQNYKTALKWSTRAAEQGHAKAQYNLGVMYYNGEGTPQNYTYAHMWWNISAASGDQSAKKNRDIIAKRMTASQREKAEELAQKCVQQEYKNC